MVLARDADFLGEGTVDQGTAGPLSLADQAKLEDMRRLRARLDARANANINVDAGGNGRGRAVGGRQINPATGQPYTGDERPETTPFLDTVGPTLKAISKDPVTAGILLSPYAVLGAGAAAGGLASGGEGSLVGASAPEMAIKGGAEAAGITRTALPSAAQSVGQPFSMASPHVAGTASGAPFSMASPFPAGAAAAGGYGAREAIHDFSPLAAPIVGGIAEKLLFGGKSKEQKALLAKQEQLAKEAEIRRQQTQTARMDALGMQVLAFNPHNQAMAQMYGPQAALAPETLAAMTHNPMAPDTSMGGYTGTDPKKKAQQAEQVKNLAEWQKANEDRYNRTLAGLSPLPQGPAPIQMPKPQPARRY